MPSLKTLLVLMILLSLLFKLECVDDLQLLGRQSGKLDNKKRRKSLLGSLFYEAASKPSALLASVSACPISCSFMVDLVNASSRLFFPSCSAVSSLLYGRSGSSLFFFSAPERPWKFGLVLLLLGLASGYILYLYDFTESDFMGSFWFYRMLLQVPILSAIIYELYTTINKGLYQRY